MSIKYRLVVISLIFLVGCNKEDTTDLPTVDFRWRMIPSCIRLPKPIDSFYIVLDGDIGTWDGSSILTQNEDVITVGEICDSLGHRMSINRTTSLGEIIYSKAFHEYNSNAQSVFEDEQGSFYVAGSKYESGMERNRKLAIAKLNRNGDPIWERTYDKQNGIRASQVDGINLDEIIISGDVGTGSSNQFIFKIDSQGNDILYREIETIEYSTVASMLLINGEKVILTGANEESNVTLSCFDLDANQIWRKTYGPASKCGRSTIVARDNSLITVGSHRHLQKDGFGVDSVKVLIMKTDMVGNVIWEKEVGDAEYTNDGQAIVENEDGSFVVVGYAIKSNEVDHMIIHLDSQGEEINSRYFADKMTTRAQNILKLSDGRNVVTGFYNWSNASFFLNVDNTGDK